MKKKFIIYFLIFFCFFSQVNSKISSYSRGQEVSGFIKLNNKTKFNLPKGKWEVFDRYIDSGYGMQWNILSLGRVENNELIEIIDIGYSNLAGAFVKYIDHGLNEVMFKNKYDGCYERPEYFIVKVYKKGSTHNCLVIDHSDVHKDFFNPDDPEIADADVKKWIKDYNIKLPKVGLRSFHAYFSRLAAGKWYLLSYGIDPTILNAPKNKFISEETSEYHKNNISNYPEHQKIMQKWVSISAKRHIEFENIIKIIERHKLDLSALSPSNSVSIKNLSSDILDQINKLNDLYKSGVLTKDEFEKAKKKILN